MTVAEVVLTLRQRLLPRRSDYSGLATSYRRDILAGITVGVVALPLALAFGGSNFQVSGPTDEHIAVYRFDGALFFGASKRFLDELVALADVRVVVLRLGAIGMMDASGAHALEEIIVDLQSRGIAVVLQGIRPEHVPTLVAVGDLEALGARE